MIYCPYCGLNVHDDEVYCLQCGEKIPRDLDSRMKSDRKMNRFWFIPLGMIILFVSTLTWYSIFLQKQTAHAKLSYEQGEENLLAEQYHQAKSNFEEALQIKSNFKQAETALQFVNTALTIQEDIELSNTELNDKEFQKALTLINDAERELRNYHGEAATNLIDKISVNREQVKLELLQTELEDNPTIDDLKVLLWEAETVNTDEAKEMVESIRNQIVDYTFSKAVEQLNKRQFSDAQVLVGDGLKYAKDAEKLLSLQTTIEKEQEAFETAQQKRIEQAMNVAEEEQELNEFEAIELQEATVSINDQGMLLVEGEVKSVATIPINSVLVEYSLLDQLGNEFISNNAFIFPDTLYPNESGKFEFTHYDVDERIKNIDIQINKITWYTD